MPCRNVLFDCCYGLHVVRGWQVFFGRRRRLGCILLELLQQFFFYSGCNISKQL